MYVDAGLKASLVMLRLYVIVHTIKLDEEKSKHAGLAQENGFESLM
jgi:hypothetical protein